MSGFDELMNEQKTTRNNKKNTTPENPDITTAAPPFGDAFEDDDIFGNGMFEDTDLEALPENPFEIPDGVYMFQVTSALLKAGKNNADRYSIELSYSVADGNYTGRKVREWLHYPTKNDGSDPGQITVSQALMKNRLTAMGVSNEDIAKKFNHKTYQEIMIGARFYGTVRTSPDRNNPENRNTRIVKAVPLDGGQGFETTVDFGF